VDVCELLLSAGACAQSPVLFTESTPLLEAAAYGHTQVCARRGCLLQSALLMSFT